MRKGILGLVMVVLGGETFLVLQSGIAGVRLPFLAAHVRPAVPLPAQVVLQATHIIAANWKVEKSGPILLGEGKLRPGNTYLVTTHFLPDIVMENKETDTLFGWAVPGKHIRVKVRVDVELKLLVKPSEVRVEVDPAFPDTFHVLLPATVQVKSAFPDDALADYEVEYGWSTFRQPEHAREMRRQLYRAALDHAQATHHLQAAKEQRRTMLEQNLRTMFPNVRIHVKWLER